MTDIDRDLGRMDAEIMALQKGIIELRTDFCELRTDIKSILLTLSEARGGWKTLMLIAGIAGAVGALLGKIVPFGWLLPK